MAIPSGPAPEDIVVRRDRDGSRQVLVLHRASGPDQVLVRSRDEAFVIALRCARRLGVRLWFSEGVEDFTLVEDFPVPTHGVEDARSARVMRSRPAKRRERRSA